MLNHVPAFFVDPPCAEAASEVSVIKGAKCISEVAKIQKFAYNG